MKNILIILFLFSCKAAQTFTASRPTVKPDYILTWVVGNEIGVKQYEIQDSVNGKWITDTIIYPTGAKTYTYALPYQNHYYRLKGLGITDFYSVTMPFIITNNVTITDAFYKTTSLIWTVSNELMVNYYLIEKSLDNKTWNKVTLIATKGNGKYSYRLSRTYKKYLYRITPIFKDLTKGTSIIFK